jgi:phosphoglucomutase
MFFITITIAGMMVTASHNPKQDNGFKVYWSNGAQIIPPHDERIASAILNNLEPWQDYSSIDALNHELAKDVTEEVADSYFSSLSKLSTRSKELNAASQLKVTYTGIGLYLNHKHLWCHYIYFFLCLF